MRKLNLMLADNPQGGISSEALYMAIERAYPELELTFSNSKIVKIQAFPARYQAARTYLAIERNDEPLRNIEFYYDRFDISLYVTNPLFDAAEAQELADKTEPDVLAAISEKIDQNLTEEDFWINPYQFTSIGGQVGPNFRLKARYDSPMWFGETVVPLHTEAAA